MLNITINIHMYVHVAYYIGSKVSKWICVDNNECAGDNLNSCHKWVTCSNIPGSYQCACNTDFVGDGFGCADIDECTNGEKVTMMIALNQCH